MKSLSPGLGVILKPLLVAAAIGASFNASKAADVADFYRGKTITIEVGYGAGGGYDISARLVAQFLGKHIPGRPRVVVEDLPGGGGLTVANAIYNTVAKDGLTLGVFASDVALEPLYGNPEAKFQPSRFEWIGSMDTDLQACGVWKGAGLGIHTLSDLVNSPKPVSFGASSPVSDTSVYPLFFKNALKAPVKVIHGYTGTQTIMLAMQNGEVEGICGIFESSVRSTYAHDFKTGNLDIFTQIVLGNEKSSVFPSATPVMDAIKTDRLRKVAKFLFTPALLARPLAAPPGTPKDRVAALRAAMLATESDPETLAAAKAASMTLKPKSGEQVQQMIEDLQNTPPDIVKEAYAYTH